MSAKKNTLFNYFTKSPAPRLSHGSSETGQSSPKENGKSENSTKRTVEKSPNGNHVTPKRPKISDVGLNGKSGAKSGSKSKQNGSTKSTEKPKSRKRIIEPEPDEMEESIDDPDPLDDIEDLDDSYQPDGSASEDNDDGSAVSEDEDESSEQEDDDSPNSKKGTKRKRKKEPTRSTKKAKPSGKPTKNKIAASGRPSLNSSTSSIPEHSEATAGGLGEDGQNWTHLQMDFLKPEKIKDASGRRPSDPDYDCRSLYVPKDFLLDQTPGHKQWWDLKAKHFDCVLFFKVGKFYELYHMDAVTGVKELNLTFMRGSYAHCGFPEIAYGRFSAQLVDKGYKVVRVEQTETPDMMDKRVKKLLKPTKFDRVVKREICQLTTKGTRVYTVADGEAREAQSAYLLAIMEKEIDRTKSSYGVCFVDTSIGVFHIGQFDDDRHSSRLRTLIATFPPVQVLHERNQLSKRTNQLLSNAVASALKEALTPETEFWTSADTLIKISERKYFEDGLPEALKKFVGDSDALGLTASAESELGVRCLGAVTWFLTRGFLDFQLLSLAKFEIYEPIEISRLPEGQVQKIHLKHMVLDAITLKNLNVVDNGHGGSVGTLLHRIDNCSSPFGKRLLRHWMCSPSTNVRTIEARQKAVNILRENTTLLSELGTVLAKVPDLERLFARIYAQSSKGLQDSHPDNRAIMFEEKIYSKRKIMEFIAVLDGFASLQRAALLMQDCKACDSSEILVQCSHFPTSEPAGSFPDLEKHLHFFKNAFDRDEAEKEGRIIPSAGVDPEYDESIENMKRLDKEMKSYLAKQCQYFQCKVVYVGKDKNRYQLEIPESKANKVTDEYVLVGQRKGFKKYSTPETKSFLERQMAAEDQKLNILADLRKRIFTRFIEKYENWYSAIECMSTLDVLMSLAMYSLSIDGDTCIPVFRDVSSVEQPFVNLVNGKFPCVTNDQSFIPNDTKLGENGQANLLLLTGPNMGGKSTLMRQLGLLVIMAQMGCIIPAESLELTPVDRIFTRIGAQDDILSGESTFYVELCETASILNNASIHSLVLVDELGRGTSTYDGTAIAAAVLNELSRMKCRTIFSTHYHTLVGGIRDNDRVVLGHMSCMVETEDEEGEGKEETVTFLYRLAEGACPKSYGFNAARLAGIPSHIIRTGSAKARQLEEQSANRKAFRSIFTSSQPKALIASL
ncbi:DNA mismatch repair protein [Nesidiocoris tenuis]|uniref:DNA mismatch repair protein n=1 Tax=Nesidiocoris tenuis TaxID=355587 RepID=A0ABN7AP70_9HEMI|nr:DNA mismatch repair protein [Nesidiocoris tenuis]